MDSLDYKSYPKMRIFGDYYELLPILVKYPVFEDNCGFIYLFDCGGKRFKVGKTCNILQRLSTHTNNYYSYTGLCPSAIAVFGPFKNVNEAEQEVLLKMKENKYEESNGAEWFYGDMITALPLLKSLKSKLKNMGIFDYFDNKFIKFCRKNIFVSSDDLVIPNEIKIDTISLYEKFSSFYTKENKKGEQPEIPLPLYLFRSQLLRSSNEHNWIKFLNKDLVLIKNQQNTHNFNSE